MTKEEQKQLLEVTFKADEIFKITCGCLADCKIKEPSFTTLNDLLDFLRINVKHIMFDLESTQREKANLEAMLNKQHHDEGDQNP